MQFYHFGNIFVNCLWGNVIREFIGERGRAKQSIAKHIVQCAKVYLMTRSDGANYKLQIFPPALLAELIVDTSDQLDIPVSELIDTATELI